MFLFSFDPNTPPKCLLSFLVIFSTPVPSNICLAFPRFFFFDNYPRFGRFHMVVNEWSQCRNFIRPFCYVCELTATSEIVYKCKLLEWIGWYTSSIAWGDFRQKSGFPGVYKSITIGSPCAVPSCDLILIPPLINNLDGNVWNVYNNWKWTSQFLDRWFWYYEGKNFYWGC